MKTFMRVIVTVVACAVLASSAADWKKISNPRLARGLNAEIAKKFSDDLKTFTCDNGATVLPVDSVNDDYCDCTDGSDEYGTSACPQGTFYCRNKFYMRANIPSGMLDDGVCDCCDGSDEPKGKCKNNCKELGAARRQEVLQRKTDVETGLKKREEMAKQGAKVLVEKKKELNEVEAKIKAKNPERDRVNKDYDEKSEAFNKKDKEIRERREKLEAERAAKAEEEKKKMVVEGDGNAEINEMVHAGTDIKPEAAAEPIEEAHAVRTKLDEPEPIEEIKPEDDPEWVGLKDAKEAARKVMDDVIGELRDLEEKKVEAERILEMQVDNDMCLVQLGTECHELRDKYTYKICPLKNSKQDGTDLGHFKSWVGDESIPLAKRQMKFDDGSHCWDGPNRNTLVTFRCGAETRVISANEPTKCSYTVTMETPCACSKEDLDEAVANINAMLADEAED